MKDLLAKLSRPSNVLWSVLSYGLLFAALSVPLWFLLPSSARTVEFMAGWLIVGLLSGLASGLVRPGRLAHRQDGKGSKP